MTSKVHAFVSSTIKGVGLLSRTPNPSSATRCLPHQPTPYCASIHTRTLSLPRKTCGMVCTHVLRHHPTRSAWLGLLNICQTISKLNLSGGRQGPRTSVENPELVIGIKPDPFAQLGKIRLPFLPLPCLTLAFSGGTGRRFRDLRNSPS